MDLKEVNQFNKNRHPWEISRCISLLNILKEGQPNASYADIGSGDLFFAKELRKSTSKLIYAVDINYKFLENKGNINKVKNLSSIPRKSLDCVVLLDVLEHIKEDEEFLGSLLEILKEEGRLLITVPAHQFLYSERDRFSGHFRRYRKKDLLKLLRKHNLKIKEDFSFYTLLFFVRSIKVLLVNLGVCKISVKGVGDWRFSKRHLLTLLITNILNIDFFINRALAKLGINLVGLSICVVAKKNPV
tara:strand:- start:448 stop:1182 length:735 start_codon:yes stop_codon:yes gene_type:complete